MACVTHAIDAYERMAENDTNPRIVQALSIYKKPIDHWYYQSDQVVSTSMCVSLINGVFMPSYEGPVSGLPFFLRSQFAEGRFEFTEDAEKLTHHTAWWLEKDW